MHLFVLFLALALNAQKTDDRITALSKAVASEPDSLKLQNQLAKAYIQKMRETVDFSYLDRSSKLIDAVLERDAGNYEALRLRSEVLMERHEFQRVADYAQEMSKFAPNDPWNWGTLGDASMELGKYEDASQAYGRMMALRPDLSSYNRMAYYKFVTGDPDQAISLMKSAIAGGSRAPENVAWCWADLGNMYFKIGKIAESQAAFEQALQVFPGYYPAYSGLGKLFSAENHPERAIEQYKKAEAAVPMPEFAAALSDLYRRAGQPAESAKQTQLLDVIEKMAVAGNEKTNRNLALLYADQDRNLGRALDLVQSEMRVRPDIYTNDAMSWVLYKLKRSQEARQFSIKALIFNTPEPSFYFHAGRISEALGNPAEARAYYERAIHLNSRFDFRAAAFMQAALKQ